MSRKRYKAFIFGKIALLSGKGECKIILCYRIVDLDQSHYQHVTTSLHGQVRIFM